MSEKIDTNIEWIEPDQTVAGWCGGELKFRARMIDLVNSLLADARKHGVVKVMIVVRAPKRAENEDWEHDAS